MAADIFGFIALIGFGMCVVFAVLTAVFAKKQHVREVREELSGRSAVRMIEELRTGRASVVPTASMRTGMEERQQNGPLRIRQMPMRKDYASSKDTTTVLNSNASISGIAEVEDATTLLNEDGAQ